LKLAPTTKSLVGRPERLAQALVALTAVAIPMVLGFDANYDQHGYHVLSAMRVVSGDWFEPLDLYLGALLNPLVNVPYGIALHVFPARAVSLLLALGAAVVVVPLLHIVRLLLPGNERAATTRRTAAMLISLSAPMWLSEVGTSYSDVLLLPAAVTSLWQLLVWIRVGARRNLLVSAATIGVAAGLKQTFAPFAVASLLVIVSAMHVPRKARVRSAAAFCLAASASFVVCAGPWMLEMWRQFRNPVFPYFNAMFRSPFATQTNWRDNRFDQRSIGRLVSLPFRLVVGKAEVAESPVRDPRWAIFLVLGLVVVALWTINRRSSRPDNNVGVVDRTVLRSVLVYVVLGYVLWAWQFGIARYALPVDVLSGPLIVVAISALARRLRRGELRLLALVFVVGVIGSRPPNWGTIPFSQSPYSSTAPLASVPTGSMVVLGNTEPSAYLAFGSSDRLRLVRPGFLFPRGSKRMNALEDAVIAQAAINRLWSVGIEADGDWLRTIGLVEETSTCEPVRATIPSVRLCQWRGKAP
jgi:hypothetical protein